MSESDEVPELNEDEQTAVAVEWYLAMWNEALKRGVAAETMALVSLSATANKLNDVFGAEHAGLLIKQIGESAGDGAFDTSDDLEEDEES